MSQSGNLPPTASVAHEGEAERLHAPSAERNAAAIAGILTEFAPRSGSALEIASGTGQHVAEFARLLPELDWQPSDIAPERLASIDSWAGDLPNVRRAVFLDATRINWSQTQGGHHLILLVNLLHLISTPRARILISETARALRPSGRFILYGPFLRDGVATSDGDARFDASLRAADPEIGYKDLAEVRRWLADAGLSEVSTVDMPANNLTLITERAVEA